MLSKPTGRYRGLAILIGLFLLIPACSEEGPGTQDMAARAQELDPQPREVAAALSPEFLETEAGMTLVEALQEGRATERLIFLHTGADW